MSQQRKNFERYIGNTAVFAFRFKVEDDGSYLDGNYGQMRFRIMSGDHYDKTFPMVYVNDRWELKLPASVTNTYRNSRSYQYRVDTVFSSGESEFRVEGSIKWKK